MKNPFQMSRRRWLLVSAASIASNPLAAQDAFPSRPVNLVVPFPPGGLADSVARQFAPSLERVLGQPVVVQNRAGAAGAIGAAAVASQGDPLSDTAARPSGAATTVSAPLSKTTAPAVLAASRAARIRSEDRASRLGNIRSNSPG